MKRLFLNFLILLPFFCNRTSHPPTEDQPPQTPQNLLAIGEYHSIILKWEKVPDKDVRKYVIYGGTKSGDYTMMVEMDTSTICRVEHLQHDTQYFFVVSTVDHANNKSEFSKEATAMTFLKYEDFSQPDGPLNPQKWNSERNYITPVVNNQVEAAYLTNTFGKIRKSFGQYPLDSLLDNVTVECDFRIGFANVGGAGLMLRSEKAKTNRFYRGYSGYVFCDGENWELRSEIPATNEYETTTTSSTRIPDLPANEWIRLSFQLNGKKLTTRIIRLSDCSILGEITQINDDEANNPNEEDNYCGFYTCQFTGTAILVDNFGIRRSL
jgi:hypothetical protein